MGAVHNTKEALSDVFVVQRDFFNFLCDRLSFLSLGSTIHFEHISMVVHHLTISNQ